MKIITALFCCLFLFVSCEKKPQAVVVPETPAADKSAALAAELKTMELQEQKLRSEIELERLAMEREELRAQREALDAKSARLSDDELELERKKTALAEERAADAIEKAREANRPLPAEPVREPDPIPARQERPVSGNIGDYDYSVFYDRLASQGSWFNSPQYGYIWRPTIYVQNNNWRPYTVGNWVYSDRGWTWCSNESFGWATYHYGRWVLLRNSGWCWIPGNQWAPAWVAWKSGGDYVGWAPLPPETLYWNASHWSRYNGASCGISPRSFSFVRSNGFGGSINTLVFSINDCVRIYSQTNYIGGYRWSGNRVNCEGISYENACKYVGRELPRYDCEFDGRPPGRYDSHRFMEARGKRLQIHAPDMNVPWNAGLQPVKIEKSVDDDEIVREKTIDPEVVKEFSSARGRDRENGEKSVRGGLAKKMTERIQLEEKIDNQRNALAAVDGSPSPKDGTKRDDKNPDRPTHLSGSTTDLTPVRPIEPLPDPAKDGSPLPESRPDDKPAIVAPAAVDGKIRPQPPVAVDPAVIGSKDKPVPGILKPGRGALPESKPDGRNGTDVPAVVQQQEEAAMKEKEMQAQREAIMNEERRKASERLKQQSISEAEKAAELQKNRPNDEQMRQRAKELAEAKMKQQQEQEALREAQQQQSEKDRDAKMSKLREAAEAAKQKAAEEEQLQQGKAAREQQMRQQQAESEARKARELDAKAAQMEAARAEQEQAREAQMRAQQEAAKQAQEQARAEQMRERLVAEKQAQEQARAEQMRAQQEAAKQAQQQAREQQMRQQQEAAREQQMRQQQEAAREQQMRQQQEAAREQQMRQQQEAAREQQMRQQQEAAREQQMRQQQEAAREQQMRQQQQAAEGAFKRKQQQDAAREAQQNKRDR
jgi:hypothetical protein